MLGVAAIAVFVASLAAAVPAIPAVPAGSAATTGVNGRLLRNIRSYMDARADPCEDFYEYACGNWERVQPNKEDYVDTIGRLEFEANQRLLDVLEREQADEADEGDEVYRKARVYYETCRSHKVLEPERHLDILKPSAGDDWPQTNSSWAARSWNIWATLGRLRAYGLNGVLLRQDLKKGNSTASLLQLDKADEPGFTAYEQSLLDEMENSLDARPRVVASNVQGLVGKLGAIHKHFHEQHGLQMSGPQMEHHVPGLDLGAYFGALLGQPLPPDQPLLVRNLGYFHKLLDLLRKTSQDTLIHYLRLKLLGHLALQAPAGARPLDCVRHMRDLMPLALDYIYEREYYRHERRQSDAVIRRVFRSIQQKFVQNVERQHGRSLSARQLRFLADKVRRMRLNIGNLPQGADRHYYRDYFRSLDVHRDHFYWNHLSALRHAAWREYRKLRLGPASPDFSFDAWPSGSPAYLPSANLLIIPHTYLQWPIFHRDFDELFLYAELGNALGHELMHGFDTNGIKYDAAGRPSSVLGAALYEKAPFRAGLECIRSHRPSSLNEKIADFSGFRLAYDTYFQPARLGRLSAAGRLASERLFFVKFAQFFCAVGPRRIHYDNSHDTPFTRVRQVVRNHPRFAAAFGCRREEGRHGRPRTCNLW